MVAFDSEVTEADGSENEILNEAVIGSGENKAPSWLERFIRPRNAILGSSKCPITSKATTTSNDPGRPR